MEREAREIFVEKEGLKERLQFQLQRKKQSKLERVVQISRGKVDEKEERAKEL